MLQAGWGRIRRCRARALSWVALWLAAMLIAPWSGASAAGPAPPPLRIGVSLGLTGTYAQLGRLQSHAYHLWQKDINDRGGILGRQVQVIVVDDRSDPEVAKTIYQGFIERDHLDFVFGPYSSAITGAIVPIVEQRGYPTLSAGANADDLWAHGYQNLFGVHVGASRYAIGFLAVLAEAGIQRIAIVSADDGFSVQAAAGMRRWAPHYGLRVVSSSSQRKDHPDMVQAAKAARAAEAQAILVAGHFNESVAMRRALREIGWSPSAYYATIGPALEKYGVELGADAEATFSTSLWEPREDLGFTGAASFLHRFIGTYGETPSYQAAAAYAAGQILEQAILKAGTTDRAAVRQALFQLDAETIIGRFAVDRTGMQIKRFPLIIQWRGPHREIVWPPEARATSPVVRK
jgi:branched-chain amino acid transport system substrate-binding protein